MKKLTARQVAALSPEMRERYEKKLKKVTRNRRILTEIIAVVAVAAVFAVLSAAFCMNSKPGDTGSCAELYLLLFLMIIE